MIGVFDSGMGGENALCHLRAMAPEADIMLLADRENSPYGTKCRDELARLLLQGVKRLRDAGCEHTLIACCTASSVHHLLPDELRAASVPIIEPTASEALAVSENGRIAVLATDATVRSRAFGKLLGSACVCEAAASPLVPEIERGARDGRIPHSLGCHLDRLLPEVATSGADTLILGCTHFMCIRSEIERRLYEIMKKKIKTVDSSALGARYMLSVYPDARVGSGRTVRL